MLEQQKQLMRERESFLRELQVKVDNAFVNRQKITFVPDQRDVVEHIEEIKSKGQETSKLLEAGVNPEDIMAQFGDLSVEPNEVVVEKSHDYMDLLYMAARKVFTLNKMGGQQMKQMVNDMLKHEFAHHVPGLGHDSLTMYYGVSFLEDPATNVIGFRPMLKLTGSISINILLEIVSAPNEKSQTDLVREGLLRKRRTQDI
jgi:hypothetical protein